MFYSPQTEHIPLLLGVQANDFYGYLRLEPKARGEQRQTSHLPCTECVAGQFHLNESMTAAMVDEPQVWCLRRDAERGSNRFGCALKPPQPGDAKSPAKLGA